MVEVAPVQHQVEGEDHDAEDRAAEHRELPAQLHVRGQRGPAASSSQPAARSPGRGSDSARSTSGGARWLRRARCLPRLTGKSFLRPGCPGSGSGSPHATARSSPAPAALSPLRRRLLPKRRREFPGAERSGLPPGVVTAEWRSEGRRCGTNSAAPQLLRSPGLPLSGAEVRRRLPARAPLPRSTDLATGTAPRAH